MPTLQSASLTSRFWGFVKIAVNTCKCFLRAPMCRLCSPLQNQDFILWNDDTSRFANTGHISLRAANWCFEFLKVVLYPQMIL